MNEALIKVEKVSKKFCRSLKKSLWYGMQDIGREITGKPHASFGKLRKNEFWALKDISFEINRGECLGLIGHNGAGKTTLLRILTGLIKIDGGRIEMRGRVGALIALGAGFNPILTGRENVYVNASVLGMTKKEIDEKIDEVIEFSEIGEFIDAPVQTYSSGMQVRLGFAVAAVMIEPDILFLDEVLAVGDIGFTIKCMNVIRNMTKNAAVVFVSHNMKYVSSFCTRVIVMEKGNMTLDTTSVGEGIDKYYSILSHTTSMCGSGNAEISAYQMYVNGEEIMTNNPFIAHGSDVMLRLHIMINNNISEANMIIEVHDEAMSPLVTYPLRNPNGEMFILGTGEQTVDIKIGKVNFNPGKYSFVIGITDANNHLVLKRMQGVLPFFINKEKKYWGHFVHPIIPIVN
jgi:lipopolysaccharide transport system ATP-binding protein